MTYQASYVSEGRSIDHTPAGNVAAGDVVVQGDLVGIAKVPIVATELGALAVEGIFDVVHDATIKTVGDAIFWNATGDPVGGTPGTGAATKTATSNTFMGFALVTNAATDATVRIALRSVESTTAETFGLEDLSDVGAVTYTAGNLLVGDGDSFESVPLTGPFNLAATGLLAMDSATVAALGDSQATAAALADGFSLVTGADAAKGVKLPAAAAGSVAVVKNNANAVLKLYPNTDDAINALAADAALSMAAYTSCLLIAYDATTWYTVPLLPS